MNFDVMDLVPNKEYKFKIKAVNKVGSSEPTPLSKVVLAKDPWGKTIYLSIYLFICCEVYIHIYVYMYTR